MSTLYEDKPNEIIPEVGSDDETLVRCLTLRGLLQIQNVSFKTLWN